jgi:hypothetical protein
MLSSCTGRSLRSSGPGNTAARRGSTKRTFEVDGLACARCGGRLHRLHPFPPRTDASCLLDRAADPLPPRLETSRGDAMVLHVFDGSQGELLERPPACARREGPHYVMGPRRVPLLSSQGGSSGAMTRKRASVTRRSAAIGSLMVHRAIRKSPCVRLACLAEPRAIGCEIEGIVSKCRPGDLALGSSIACPPSFHLSCTRLVDVHPRTARHAAPDRIVLLSGETRRAVSRCKHRRATWTVSQIALRGLQGRMARRCRPEVTIHPTDPRSIASHLAQHRRSPSHRYKAHEMNCAARAALDSESLCTTSKTGAPSLEVSRSTHSRFPVAVYKSRDAAMAGASSPSSSPVMPRWNVRGRSLQVRSCGARKSSTGLWNVEVLTSSTRRTRMPSAPRQGRRRSNQPAPRRRSPRRGRTGLRACGSSTPPPRPGGRSARSPRVSRSRLRTASRGGSCLPRMRCTGS